MYLSVSSLPNMVPSAVMRRINGRSSTKPFDRSPELKYRYWGMDCFSVTPGKNNRRDSQKEFRLSF